MLRRLILSTSIFVAIVVCAIVPAIAQPAKSEITLFDGITKQTFDFSCGPAALSTLLGGLIDQNTITELDIIHTRKVVNSNDNLGFTLQELAVAAESVGHKAEWRKVSRDELSRIPEPVILLIGLNSYLPHYVVLKGIKDDEAYMADPIRGNIRMSYDELASEGLNSKYPRWYVMAINYGSRKRSASPLYLSDYKSERNILHYTIEQSNAITLISFPKSKQFIFEHTITYARSSAKAQQVDVRSINVSNDVAVRYGFTPDTEIGLKLGATNSFQKYSLGSQVESDRSTNEELQISLNQKIRLPRSIQNDHGLIFGLSGSRSFNRNDIGASVSAFGYINGKLGQFVLGGKLFQQLKSDEEQPKQQVSSFLSAFSRPIGSYNVVTLTGSIDLEKMRGSSTGSSKYYSFGVSLASILSKNIQVTPALTYTFGDNSAFVIGITTTYLGPWN